MCQVDDATLITTYERKWQIELNAVNDEKYYNIVLAGEKFTSAGLRWYHDPTSPTKGYFPPDKVPTGWQKGKSPETSLKTDSVIRNSTGLKKGSTELSDHISNSIARIEWTLRDPAGNLHTVTKLHKFCDENGISHKLRRSNIFDVPIKKGAGKGWSVVSKKSTRT